MASAPKPIKHLSGITAKPVTSAATASENPAAPYNPRTMVLAIQQLQTSLNELISRFNGHTHSAGAVAAPDAATRVQGTAVAATNLFNDA